ncbi:MAG: hypothetical protein OK457_09920 [Thaumarchaeota archaeon]|nr:hypothetical protein [Nitrososphaerota archaeon]
MKNAINGKIGITPGVGMLNPRGGGNGNKTKFTIVNTTVRTIAAKAVVDAVITAIPTLNRESNLCPVAIEINVTITAIKL